MNIKRTIKTILITIMLITLLTACNVKELSVMFGEKIEQEEQIKLKDSEIVKLEGEIESLQSEIDKLKVKITFLGYESEDAKKLLERVLPTYSEEQLHEFFKNAWDYEIGYSKSASDEDLLDIPFGEEVIEITSENLIVSISERFLILEILDDYSDQKLEASISSGEQSYSDNMELITDYEYELGGRDGTVATSRNYLFKDIKDDFRLEVKISEELAKRIGAESRSVIFVKGE